MRLPWDRSKPSQLDLLATEQPAALVEAPLKAPMAKSEALPQEVPSVPVAEPSRPPTGEPLLVPLSALCEDPDNPRTEFPPAELQELAEDIRLHGILQPIVVQPADADGLYRIHFGAKRFRAAGLAGLEQVPVTVRPTGADPYAQVAENQKRHGLAPLDLARFIRGRVDLGESNATIAKRLGMDLTTVAHYLALLDLPAPLAAALKSGRCSAPRTLYELAKVHADRPQAVIDLLEGDKPITREAVAALRRPARASKPAMKRPAAPKKPREAPASVQLVARAERLCTQLAAACSQLRGVGLDQLPPEQLEALRGRLRRLDVLLAP
ncbi:MAG: ParB/RepB/Spo0J family partition protein [Gammaproteobacteria bacterium]